MAKSKKHRLKMTMHRRGPRHLGAKHREYFASNLSYLLKAGVPMSDALKSLEETSTVPALKQALHRVGRDVEEGNPLWRSLDHSGLVSPQSLILIRIGESSGSLTDNLRLAAEQERKQRAFQSKLRSAMIYPAFVLSMMLAVGLGVAWFLLPRLAQAFGQMGLQLPLISRVIIQFGVFLQHWGVLTLAALAAAIIGLVVLYRMVEKVRTAVYGCLIYIPGISRLIKELEVARFGYLLGSLLQAGLSLTEALAMLRAATTTPQYRRLYVELSKSLDEGYGFREAFSKHKEFGLYIPSATQQAIFASEQSSALPEALVDIGEAQEEKVEITMRNLETLLEPVLLVLAWLGVLAIAVGVILPIYGLVGDISGQ